MRSWIPASRSSATDKIVLSRVEVTAMMDSLRRGRVAAESAGMLAAKASRAFAEEAKVIEQCETVLASYLDD